MRLQMYGNGETVGSRIRSIWRLVCRSGVWRTSGSVREATFRSERECITVPEPKNLDACVFPS